MTSSLPDWIKHLQFAKRRCSGLEHIFQEEVKQYYLHPHAALNSSFNQAFHRALYWDQFSSPYMFQTLRVLLPPTVSPATSMQMTPRSTATAALRAFLILSVECRPVSEKLSRGRHLIVYDSTLTKQRQYGLVLQPDAVALAPQHFNWQVQPSFLRRQSEAWECIWIHPWRWVLTLVGLLRAVMPSFVSSRRLNHLCHITFSFSS